MTPIDFLDRIQNIREHFAVANESTVNQKNTRDIINLAETFEYDTAEKLNALKKQYPEHSETIQICEELAQFYLDCGEKHFAQDKNATTTVDRMLACAEP